MKKFNIILSKLFALLMMLTCVSAFADDYNSSQLYVHESTYALTAGSTSIAKNTWGPANGSYYDYFFSGNGAANAGSYQLSYGGTNYSNIFKIKSDRGFAFKIKGGQEWKISIIYRNDNPAPALYISDSYPSSGTDLYASVTPANNGGSASCLTYTYTPTNDEVVWLKGTDGTTETQFCYFVLEHYVAPDVSGMTTISDNYMWHANSAIDLPANGYQTISSTTDNHIFHFGTTAREVGENDVYVNSVATPGYDLAAGEALGFKLAGGKKYRVNVFVNSSSTDNSILYYGQDPTSAGYVGDPGVVTNIKNQEGVTTDTKMLTYTLNPTGDTYHWVKAPAAMTIGGIEILPFDTQYDGNVPAMNATSFPYSWIIQGASGSVDNAAGTAIWAPHSNNGTFYIVGPRMNQQHSIQVNRHITVLINNDNGIGFKVPTNTPFSVSVSGLGETTTGLVLKEGASLSSANIVATSSGDFPYSTLSYSTTTTSETTYWVTGAGTSMVYIDGITYDQKPGLEAITTDELWFYNVGSGLGNTGTTKVYRAFPKTDYPAVSKSETALYVNGTISGGLNNGASGSFNSGSYNLTSNDYIAFKLQANKKYKIKVYTDVNCAGTNYVLYSGDYASTATGVTPTDVTKVKDYNNSAAETNTYVATYDITPTSDTIYWIHCYSGMLLGGFEVLPADLDQTTSLTQTALTDDGVDFTASTYTTSQQNTLDTQTSYNKLTSGNHNYFSVYGPTLVVNSVNMPIANGGDDSNTVMVNNANAIALTVPAAKTVTIPMLGPGTLVVKEGTDLSPATAVSGLTVAGTDEAKYSVVYTNTSTTESKTIWLTASDAAYVYLTGVTVEDADTDNLTPITDNYLWYGDAGTSTLAANDYCDADSKHFSKHVHDGGNDALQRSSNINMPYRDNVKGYLMSANHSIKFMVDKNYDGIIEVYYPTGSSMSLACDGTAQTALTSTTINDIVIDTYKVEPASANRKYAITGTGTLGGFDVVKNVYKRANAPGTIRTDKGINTGSMNKAPVANALNSSDKYNVYQVLSTDMGEYHGPVRVRMSGSVNTANTLHAGILFNQLNAIAFRVPAGKVVKLTAQFRGPAGSGLKLVKAAPVSTDRDAFASGTTVQTINSNASATSLQNKTFDPLTVGSEDELYWITGASLTDAIFYGFDLDITDPNATPLTIEQYHLFPAGETMKTGKLYDNGFVLYKGSTSPIAASSTTQLEVMDQMLPTYPFASGDDHLGIKVDEGKTGVIRAYFSPTTGVDLPLNNLGAGQYSSYDPDTKTITFNYKTDDSQTNATTASYAAFRGWWYGQTNPGDFSASNVISIELAESAPVSVQLVVKDIYGATVVTGFQEKGSTSFVVNLDQEGFDKSKVESIQFQLKDFITDANSNKIVLKSAQALTSEVNLAKGTDANTPAVTPTLSGDATYSIYHGTTVMEYRFPANAADQMYWLSGAMNLAAVEVLYDVALAREKIIEWYVNSYAKEIVGSNDPGFTCSAKDGNTTKSLNYTTSADGSTDLAQYNIDEYVTFLVSGGQRAKISWMMPQVSRDIIAWDKAVAAAITEGTLDKISREIDEATTVSKTDATLKYQSIIDSYGKHQVELTVLKGKDSSGGSIRNFNRSGLKGNKSNISGLNETPSGSPKEYKKLRGWYDSEILLPDYEKIDSHNANRIEEVIIKGTQKPSPDSLKIDATMQNKEWVVFMRFIFLEAPVVNVPDEATQLASTSAQITVSGGQSGYKYYYTTDSSDPVDKSDANITRDQEFSTTEYSQAFSVDYNCFVKAAQFIPSPYPFYENGRGSKISRKFMLLSNDQPIELKPRDDTYYFKHTGSDAETFGGGTMLSIPAAEKVSTSNPRTLNVMLGTDTRPYYRSLSGIHDFRVGAITWKYGKDTGYKTFIDSYQDCLQGSEYTTTGTEIDYPYTDTNGKNHDQKSPQKPNGNPNTECNDGIGGKTTEDGGLFLAPIAGDFVRLEPEYDGVVSLWIRQNGAVEYETMEDGEITRRPTYVVDENGKIMRASTVKPTATHHLGVNGMYAVHAGNSELRSTFEHTWLYGISRQVVDGISAADEHWMQVNDPDTINDYRSSYLLYGMWFDGLDIDANRSAIKSAKYASRYIQTGTQPLYRGDWLENQETKVLGVKVKFAKYGYEVPNFAYVRYRIPVKAGKTYYVGERGSKNGFIAVQFEPLECNINYNGTTKYTGQTVIEDYRYADNPDVVESAAARAYFDWTKADDTSGRKNNAKVYSASTVMDTYDTSKTAKRIETLTINENADTNQAALNAMKVSEYNMDGLSYNNVSGVTADVTLNRTFKKGHWHPIVLPFSVSETKLKEMFGDGVQVLYLDPIEHSLGHERGEDGTWRSVIKPAIENSTLTFTYHRYQMLYANVPAFICPNFNNTKGVTTTVVEGVTQLVNPVFKHVTIEKSNLRSDGTIGYDIGGGYEIVGSYDKVTPGVDMYFISNSGGTSNTATMYRNPDGTTTMKGTRVWIQKKSVDAAPLRTIGYADFTGEEVDEINGEAGIQDVIMDDVTVEMYDDDNIYDMLGRIVGHGSLDEMPKGVYIFHGKKEYVR